MRIFFTLYTQWHCSVLWLNQKHYKEYLKLPDLNNDNASLEELFVVGDELYFSYSELYSGNVIGDTMVVYGFYNLYRQDEMIQS